MRPIMLCMALLGLCLSAGAVEVAFELVDEATVLGIDTMRWQPLRLGDAAAEGLTETPPTVGEQRWGTLTLGTGEDAGRAVLLDYTTQAPAIYLDFDADGGIGADEVCPLVEPGLWEARLTPAGQADARTVQLKLGAAGRMLLYAVRGCRMGALPTDEGARPGLLLDSNGDCVWGTDGRDQLCCDLDGDGQFAPAVERVALKPSVHIGEQEWSVEVTPSGEVLTVDERDRQIGRLLATVALQSGEITSALLTLVRDDGLPLAVRELGVEVELPEGTYRLSGADLRVTDGAGVAWRFPFSGAGRGGEIVVTAGATTEAALLMPLTPRLSVPDAIEPGDLISVTVNPVSVEGLVMGAAARGGETISALAWLHDPDGRVVDSDNAGFG